jgi:hypothetical protein
VTCASFDADWKCIGCSHPVNRAAFKLRGSADPSNKTQAVILADQAVPVILPACTELLCFKILIIENGSLRELADEFLKQLGNRRVPHGSCVLIFSASYLAEAGTVAYAEELLGARVMIQDSVGKSTKVLPLPPVLLGGCDSPHIITALYEILAWFNVYYINEEGYPESTMKEVKLILDEQGRGKQQMEFRRMLLPDKSSSSGRKAWKSGGPDSDSIPSEIRPLTSSLEKRWIDAMISELRSKQALDLDPSPTLERGLGVQPRAFRKVDVLVVGSSNAARGRLQHMQDDGQ